MRARCQRGRGGGEGDLGVSAPLNCCVAKFVKILQDNIYRGTTIYIAVKVILQKKTIVSSV